MKYQVVNGEYYQKEDVGVSVSGGELDSPWVTSEGNVRRTIEILRHRKAEIEAEILLNEEILKGVAAKAAEVKLLSLTNP